MNSALLYRLQSDRNPVHVDPEFAKLAGFKAPILHGLCSYSHSCRVVFDKFGDAKPENIKKLSVRFTQVFHPGLTLVIEMWKEDNKVYFETKNKENQVVVLKACMEF